MIHISENIQLQNITIKDHTKLVSLLEKIYPPAYKHLWKQEDYSFYINKFFSKENLQKELKDVDANYFFVLYKSEQVGIFRIKYNCEFADQPNASSSYIHRIYLSENAQGKSVAKSLFYWAETQCKQKGNNLIWLKAMDSQKQALRFYEKQGYIFSSKTKLDFNLIHEHLRGMHILYKPLTT
jgi:GNAT superfamily N-acetyltransferase